MLKIPKFQGRKFPLFLLVGLVLVLGGVFYSILFRRAPVYRKSAKLSLPSPTPIDTTGFSLATPTGRLEDKLQNINARDEKRAHFYKGKIITLEESVATIVFDRSELSVRLDRLPLYKAKRVDFNPSELNHSAITDFKPESDVVVIYNHLGYPEKIVLIKP